VGALRAQEIRPTSTLLFREQKTGMDKVHLS
jgi:hypothetical protein